MPLTDKEPVYAHGHISKKIHHDIQLPTHDQNALGAKFLSNGHYLDELTVLFIQFNHS